MPHREFARVSAVENGFLVAMKRLPANLERRRADPQEGRGAAARLIGWRERYCQSLEGVAELLASALTTHEEVVRFAKSGGSVEYDPDRRVIRRVFVAAEAVEAGFLIESALPSPRRVPVPLTRRTYCASPDALAEMAAHAVSVYEQAREPINLGECLCILEASCRDVLAQARALDEGYLVAYAGPRLEGQSRARSLDKDGSTADSARERQVYCPTSAEVAPRFAAAARVASAQAHVSSGAQIAVLRLGFGLAGDTFAHVKSLDNGLVVRFHEIENPGQLHRPGRTPASEPVAPVVERQVFCSDIESAASAVRRAAAAAVVLRERLSGLQREDLQHEELSLRSLAGLMDSDRW